MAVTSVNILKSYFADGEVPTGQQYSDLLDTMSSGVRPNPMISPGDMIYHPDASFGLESDPIAEIPVIIVYSNGVETLISDLTIDANSVVPLTDSPILIDVAIWWSKTQYSYNRWASFHINLRRDSITGPIIAQGIIPNSGPQNESGHQELANISYLDTTPTTNIYVVSLVSYEEYGAPFGIWSDARSITLSGQRTTALPESRLPIGTDSQVLTAMDGLPTWMTPDFVSHPLISTDTAIARWDGISGNSLKDSPYALLNDSGEIGIGSSPHIDQSIGTEGRRYITVSGISSSGVIELTSPSVNSNSDGSTLGVLQFTDQNMTDVRKRSSWIAGETDGVTENDRGGQLWFVTKLDGENVAAVRMAIRNDGKIGIGNANLNPETLLHAKDSISGTIATFESTIGNASINIISANSGVAEYLVNGQPHTHKLIDVSGNYEILQDSDGAIMTDSNDEIIYVEVL